MQKKILNTNCEMNKTNEKTIKKNWKKGNIN